MKGLTLPYFYAKDERVLVDGFMFGTVYQDQGHNDEVVHVFLDRAKNVVKSYLPSRLKPMSAEEEAFLNIQLNQPVNPVKVVRIDVAEILNLVDAHTEEVDFSSLEEEAFRYKAGDRVKLKYNGNTGTIAQDEASNDTDVRVRWDKTGKLNWEHKVDLQTLHAPRETNNPNQALIDQIDELRRPLIIELEKRQAVLAKLTAAKKILQKG